MKVLFFLFLFFLAAIVASLAFHSPEDFCQDYWSAKYFLSGRQIYAPVNCGTLTYNAHPPFSIILFVPFAFLPLVYATFVWSLISFACYVIAGLLLLRMVGWLSYRNSFIFIILSGIWPAFLVNTAEHTIGQVLFLLLVVSWVQQNKHPYRAGILIGLASLLHIFPTILLAGFLLNKEYKSAFSGIATLVTGSIIAFLLVGEKAYMEYLGKIRIYEYANWIMHPLNISLTGIFTKIPVIAPGSKVTFSTAVTIGEVVSVFFLVITIFFIWRFNRWQKYTRRLSTQALFIPIACLSFPLFWGWMLILFLIPCTFVIFLLQKHIKLSQGWYVLLGIGSISLLDLCDLFFTKINTTDYAIVRSYLYLVSYGAIFQTIGIILFIVAQIILVRRVQLQVKGIDK